MDLLFTYLLTRQIFMV